MAITANPPKYDKRQPASGGYNVIVYKDGGEIIAEDNNGQPVSSSATASTVLQAALDSLTASRVVKETVKVVGDLTIGTKITLPSYSILDLRTAKLTLGNTVNDSMFYGADVDYVDILGGELNGNRANQSTSHLLNFWNPQYVTIDGSIIRQFKSSAIFADADASYQGPLKIFNVDIDNNGDAASYGVCVNLVGVDKVYDIELFNTNVGKLTGNGIYARGGKMKMMGCNISQCGEAGLYYYAAYRSRIIGNKFEYNKKESIHLVSQTHPSIIANIIRDSSYGNANTYSAVRISGSGKGANVSMNNFYDDATPKGTKYCIEEQETTDENIFQGNNFAAAFNTGAVLKIGPKSKCFGNLGYISTGEVQSISGTIATLTEDAFNSIDNPFGQPVALLSLDIYVSTAATATSPNIDCGIGSGATTDYATLFDDLPGETIGFYKSTIATPGTQTVPQLWASGSGNRYLNMSIKGAAATGMVATYVATVMGL